MKPRAGPGATQSSGSPARLIDAAGTETGPPEGSLANTVFLFQSIFAYECS